MSLYFFINNKDPPHHCTLFLMQLKKISFFEKYKKALKYLDKATDFQGDLRVSLIFVAMDAP